MAIYPVAQAITELKREAIWNRAAVGMEPLVGAVDGANRVFRTVSAPIDSDTLRVYANDWSPLSLGADYALEDEETGSILFTQAPQANAFASYSVTELTNGSLLGLVQAGFDEMEARLARGLYLYGSGTSAGVSASSTEAVDPFVDRGDGVVVRFSEARRHINFFLACCKYRIAQAMLEKATSQAMSYREERTGGLMVDTTKSPAAWKVLVDSLDAQLREMALEAGASWGFVVAPTHSATYDKHFQWRG